MLKMWHCPHSHTTAAVMIDISCPLEPTAANLQQWLDRTDRQMDGWMER